MVALGRTPRIKSVVRYSRWIAVWSRRTRGQLEEEVDKEDWMSPPTPSSDSRSLRSSALKRTSRIPCGTTVNALMQSKTYNLFNKACWSSPTSIDQDKERGVLLLFCGQYLLGYDAVLLEVLWSELVITSQAAYFDLWILGLDQFRAKAQQNSCHALAPFLRGNAETFHQHGLPIINHTHRLQSNLPRAAQRKREDTQKNNTTITLALSFLESVWLLCGVCMCLRGLYLGTPASSLSPKTCRLG